MGHLVVITTPDLAPGYQLAGVETHAVAKPEKAQALLRNLMQGEDASLIAVRQDLLEGIDPRLQRQIDGSYRPIVMAIPGGGLALRGEGRQRYIAELIRRAIGFHITFGAERPRRPPL
jgi:vacuolar-type H+-ATPase subunit F/Vma7